MDLGSMHFKNSNLAPSAMAESSCNTG